MGEAFAHDGKDIWSSIGGDAGKWWQRRLVRWKDCKMRVAPAARGQRSRVTEEMFGVAPGWGSDGVYDGKAANMEVAPAAWGQRSRVTEETFGAVSETTRGSVTVTARTLERLRTWRLHPLRGGSVRARLKRHLGYYRGDAGPAAWGKCSRVTGETVGAVSGATRGSGGSDGLNVGKAATSASRPLRGGSVHA